MTSPVPGRIISLRNVSKTFRADRGTKLLLGRGGLPDLIRGRRMGTVHALDEITFDVRKGESLGIIGANGSGKSTLLRLIAGVSAPTRGTVEVSGRVASLLELGAGFHPMLTGRENVYLNAGILGMRHAQVDEVFDEIVAFAGLHRFIDFPVDTYSSGMFVRLGFAVAAHTNPDIFLIDEVLAVGDEEFQRRCRQRIGELMEQGKTILFVSHDLSIVNVLCQRVILLSQGKMIMRSSPTKAIDFYLRQIGAPEGLHTLRDGAIEVILCNGRISIFFDENEVTSAQGIMMQVYSMNTWHTSQLAEWQVVERSEQRCVARGNVHKLGLTFLWDLRLQDGSLTWSVAYECTGSLHLSAIETRFAFPLEYTRWVYDDTSGQFHEIMPDDTAWIAVRSPELLCEHAGLLADREELRPTVKMTFASDRPMLRGSWWNADYMSRSRLLLVQEQTGEMGVPLPEGRTDCFRVQFNIGTSRDSMLREMGAEAARATVVSGALRGRFDRGRLRLTCEAAQLPSGAYVYSSLRIENLWNDSSGLRWDRLERVDDGIRVTGTSRRFPFAMEWAISPGETDELRVSIDLDVRERMEVQEYQASVMLPTDYSKWESPDESGDFPEIRAEANDWIHLNHNYAPGSSLKAVGSTVPAMEFAVEEPSELTLTVLNSDYAQNARVLQALAVPKHSVFTFEPGRHRYFSGIISIR